MFRGAHAFWFYRHQVVADEVIIGSWAFDHSKHGLVLLEDHEHVGSVHFLSRRDL